ncbi:MAG TPA: hypothetical protein VKA34_16530 [Balneolales bacterium]|nr:hypothetical protein [Balneolales bacterium]
MNVATLKHSIDGRIRLKVGRLKGDSIEAIRITSLLHQLEGITEVKANDVTGSLVVHYDVNVINADLILGYLHKNRVFETIELVNNNEIKTGVADTPNVNIPTNEIVKTVLYKAMEIAAERAIVALL